MNDSNQNNYLFITVIGLMLLHFSQFIGLAIWFQQPIAAISIEYYMMQWILLSCIPYIQQRWLKLGVWIFYFSILFLIYWLIISRFYSIYSPLHLLNMVQFAAHLHLKLALFFVLLLSVNIIWLICFFKISQKKFYSKIWLSTISLVIVLISVQIGISKWIEKYTVSFEPITSVVMDLMLLENSKTPFTAEMKNWPYPTALEVSGILTSSTPPKKILYIVAESWGWPIQQSELQAQIAPIQSLPSIRNFQLQPIQFWVGTMGAEIRELCHQYSDFLQDKDVLNLIDEKRCLPYILRQQGYQTYSAHGASSKMYDRYLWYSHIGFEYSYFYQDKLANMQNCYSFEGWCDKDWLPYLFKWLNTDKPTLVYWLSLNIHYPYDERDILEDKWRNRKICDNFHIDKQSERCTYQLLQQQFFTHLAEAIAFHQKTIDEPIKVVIVGDHAPAFTQKTATTYYKSQQVPMITFDIIPK